MTETMQRWSMNALGRENLRLIQEPVQTPGPGEVRVRVNAVALNYRDKMVIEGTMPIPLTFPFTPASDMAGVVDSTGEGVTRFKPGARVISTFFPEWIDGRPQADARNLPYKTSGGYFQGMLAEYVIVKAIRDGVIDARVDHENAIMISNEAVDLYATNEPQAQLVQRIDFCLQLHNDSVKAMRYSLDHHRAELDSASAAHARERELVKEIAEGDLGDSEDDWP